MVQGDKLGLHYGSPTVAGARIEEYIIAGRHLIKLHGRMEQGSVEEHEPERSRVFQSVIRLY